MTFPIYEWRTERKKDEVEDFVIHCEAGMSRSPGVALALSEILNGVDSNYEDQVQVLYDINHHNIIVRKKILDTYYSIEYQENLEYEKLLATNPQIERKRVDGK